MNYSVLLRNDTYENVILEDNSRIRSLGSNSLCPQAPADTVLGRAEP